MPGRVVFDDSYATDLKALLSRPGMTVRKAAAELGMSPATAYRVLGRS